MHLSLASGRRSTHLKPLLTASNNSKRFVHPTASLGGIFKPPPIEKDVFHHEYSIRPDTYAFKVANTGPHPLQKSESARFNAIDFIYKHATNYPFSERSPEQVFNTFPMINAAKLNRRTARPSKVKMLTGDFIEDSLYNQNYGYFSKEVEIFHPEKPFDYNNITDIDDFLENWKSAYSKYDQNETPKPSQPLPKPAGNSKFASRAVQVYQQDAQVALQQSRRSLQLWHTPTELFLPHYGEALARYLLVNYKLNGSYPYADLVIYEMGGGNGTLMCNVLNYIKENQPDVYARTHYKIIEISSQLATKQMESALRAKLAREKIDNSKVEVINKSIFAWDKVVQEPCFFIALEVFDNFPHDLVRYDNTTGEPHEGYVLVDEHGDFFEFFTPELSYYTDTFLRLRESSPESVLKKSRTWKGKLETAKSLMPFKSHDKIHPLLQSSHKFGLKNSLFPFKDNLTPGEFIPTRLLQFFQILRHRFPNHSLICSDFNALPKTIPGYYNAPVVQTVLKDKMVDVTTYMVNQGYFDIMFATDFNVASSLYKQVTGKMPRVELHRDFLEQWADVEATTTKTGENPMLDFYRNVSFMVS